MNERQRRYVLLEREGIVSLRNAGSVAHCWEQFAFVPRALEALRLLAAEDYAAIIISRQTWASKGQGSSKELDAITRRFLLQVALAEGHIAGVYYCRHRKEDECNCFAPAGLIARACLEHGFVLENTYFIGEKEIALEAAAAAGCHTLRIQRDAFLQPEMGGRKPLGVASNLYEAVEQVLATERVLKSMHASVLA